MKYLGVSPKTKVLKNHLLLLLLNKMCSKIMIVMRLIPTSTLAGTLGTNGADSSNMKVDCRQILRKAQTVRD